MKPPHRLLHFVFCWLTCLAFSAHVQAEDIYIAQNSKGSDTAIDANNAHSLAWLNTSSNWGVGAGKVSPGDTVHLCGTFTSALTIQGSGTAGNVITILFEDNAKFSAATWPNNSNIFFINGKSYVTFDGGSNGVIEATANGERLANQNQFYAIYCNACDHLTFKNLTIRNIWVRASGDTGVKGDGIFMMGFNGDCVVDNCKISEVFYGVWVGFQGTPGPSNLTISNNILYHCGQSIVIGDMNANCSITNVTISGNRIDGNGVWYDDADVVHADGIHIQPVNGGTSSVNQLNIFGNDFGPDMGAHCTAEVYLEGDNIKAWKVYNNIFRLSNPTVTNGAIYHKGKTGGLIANNTFVGSQGGGIAINMNPAVTSELIRNNIFTGVDWAIYWDGTSPNYSSDYNNIYRCTSGSKATEGPNSTTGNPSLALDLKIQTLLSLSLLGKGANLSTYFTTDKDGVLRTTWDIGAYASGGGIAPPSSAKINVSLTGP
jgi:hypothetical protein